jgi:hypothetical protein
VLVSGLEVWCSAAFSGRKGVCVGSLVQWHSSGYVGLANLVCESKKCVGSRVHLVGVSISFEKNFYRLPFTPPFLVCRFGPSLITKMKIVELRNLTIGTIFTKMSLWRQV